MIPIALTIGDPNGIGPEIAVKAAAALAGDALTPILVGDAAVVESYAARLAPGMALHDVAGGEPARGAINLFAAPGLPHGCFAPGRIEPAAGRATVAYVEAAVGLVRAGRARAIVACPHSETAINQAGIPFRGYPGLLARILGVPEQSIFLLLIGGGLRILHATLHERLADALDRLTVDLIEDAGRALVTALGALGVASPRIGLFGINPHAGENGLFGEDDRRITEPAAQRLRDSGFHVEGPLGADVFLARRDLDAYVAIYHDQGHIPVKMLAPRSAVALSVGGDIVFSSVGHGSAFDIAGRDIADPSALIAALRLVAGRGASPIGEKQ